MPLDDDPPAWLSDEAREVWAETAAKLSVSADVDALSMYCSAVADYRQAQRLLNRAGLAIQGRGGGLVSSPLNRVKQANAGIVRALARDLGLKVPDVPEERPKRHGWRNQAAVERTLTGMRNAGRLELVDEATVALARTLASALDRVDAESHPAQVASLARSQIAALRMLRGSPEDDRDSSFADIVAALSAAEMGDAPES